jgi:uncharacterized protein YuzB (UPF0349 family)
MIREYKDFYLITDKYSNPYDSSYCEVLDSELINFLLSKNKEFFYNKLDKDDNLEILHFTYIINLALCNNKKDSYLVLSRPEIKRIYNKIDIENEEELKEYYDKDSLITILLLGKSNIPHILVNKELIESDYLPKLIFNKSLSVDNEWKWLI